MRARRKYDVFDIVFGHVARNWTGLPAKRNAHQPPRVLRETAIIIITINIRSSQIVVVIHHRCSDCRRARRSNFRRRHSVVHTRVYIMYAAEVYII